MNTQKVMNYGIIFTALFVFAFVFVDIGLSILAAVTGVSRSAPKIATSDNREYEPNFLVREYDGSFATYGVRDGMVFDAILPEGKTDIAEPNCVSDEDIRLLGKSGRICAVFGHQWRRGRPGEADGLQ